MYTSALAHLQPAVKGLDTALGSNVGMKTLWTLARKHDGECMEVPRSISGPTEIRTRVSAVRGRCKGVSELMIFAAFTKIPLDFSKITVLYRLY